VGTPRVSVLLPVRDAAATLPECLDSLAAQTLGDHETVVVDDGSSDESPHILDERRRRDSRLRVLRTPPRGIAAALNLALRAARAPLVARMDGDDVALPDRLLRQVERLDADPAVGVLGCRVEHVPDPGVPPSGGMHEHVRWHNALLDHESMARDRFVDSPLVHPSVVVRREVMDALGGYADIDGPEDYELWLRAFDAGVRFAKLADVLLRWRDHPSRATRRDPRYAPRRFVAVKCEALARGSLAGGRRVVIWGAGRIGKEWARALRRGGHEVAAFVEVDARKVGRRVHGAPVVPVEEAGALRGPLHIAAVGQRGARERIRKEAERLGLGERDLVAVA